METTWQQLLADRRVWLGPLGNNRAFKDFVEITVPEIIDENAEAVATFELWIKIQHQIASALAKISTGTHNKNIATSLSGHGDKDLFLLVHNTSEEGYALQMRGLYQDQYERLNDKKITIGQLFRENPVAFLGPLLRVNELSTH